MDGEQYSETWAVHIAVESRFPSGGLICGSGFDSAESFDSESFEPELTTEGLVAGQPRTKMESDTHISLHHYKQGALQANGPLTN